MSFLFIIENSQFIVFKKQALAGIEKGKYSEQSQE